MMRGETLKIKVFHMEEVSVGDGFRVKPNQLQIDQDFDGDAYFDSLSEEDWKIVWEEDHPATEKETLPYKFMRLERIRNTSY